MSSGNPQDVTVSFAVQGLAEELHVLAFEGEEGLSQLFQFRVDLACKKSGLDFSQVVGRPAVMTLKTEAGKRYVHGMVARFVQRQKARKFSVYQATLVPRAWRLLHRRDSRIFQKKNVKQIVKKVLGAAKVACTFQLKGNQDPPEREYCVQYRESDWNFVCRLMEEEGFYYYFEHKADKHVLHFGNDALFHPDIAGGGTVCYHAPTDATPGEEHIFALQYEEGVRTGKVTLSDFNFEKPTLDQKSPRAASKDTDLEVYDYPGLFALPTEGKTLAQVRLEEVQVQRAVLNGGSDCTRFVPGYCFTLDGYFRTDLNEKKYVITRMTHLGEKDGDLEAGAVSDRMRCSNSFSAIPKSVTFRPPRVTPKPFVQGAQTAIVTGPGTEEIYTDKYGRVKVQFHWDRLGKSDAHSSCWVRVSQLWAGQGWGAMFIPRIGHEVIVDFLEGDPDRPIITGRVYHAQNVPPYTLPAERTKSTIKSESSLGGGGFNELRFEDKKGKEEIYTHAQRDQTEVVGHDMSTSVGHDMSTSVGHDKSVTVKHDFNTTVTDGNYALTVSKGTMAIKVETDDGSIVGKKGLTFSAAKGFKASGQAVGFDARTSIKLTCGKSTILMSPGEIKINAAMVKINC